MIKPKLAELDPARKAATIGTYARDTGVVPDALLGLTVTGNAEDRIAALLWLLELLTRDPSAKHRVPPRLIDFAEFVGPLADADAIPPENIIKVGDGLMRNAFPGAGADQPNPGLVLLASSKSDAGVEGGEQPDGEPEGQPDSQTADNQPNAAPEGAMSSGEMGENDEYRDDKVDSNEGVSPAEEEDDGGDDPARDDDEEFPPDKLDRLNDLLPDPDLDPDPSALGGTLGAFRRAGDRIVSSLDEAKATASEAEKKAGELILSLVPGLGEVTSAGDAVKAFREADRLLKEGKLDAALGKQAEGSLIAFGAIPFIGKIAKVPKVAEKFERLFRASRVGRLEPGNPRSFSIPRFTNRKIVSQFDQPTCGTSSCAMTLTILTGASPDIRDINRAAGLTKGGVTLPNLAKVLRNTGVPQARRRLGVSVAELEKAVKGNKPAIVYMDLDRGAHAVVVDGFAERSGRKFVAVLDPAGETANKPGRGYLVPIDEFIKRFTGEAVLTNQIR